MRILSCLLIFFLLSSGTIFSQIKIVKFDQLNEHLNKTDDRIKIVNFWATWCGPCVKELPYIDSIGTAMSDDIDMLLVTLDFADQEDKVNKFVKKKGYKSDIWLLDESDANSFIDRVDTRWSGAIPATLLIDNNTAERIFLEKELEEGDLEHYIEILKSN